MDFVFAMRLPAPIEGELPVPTFDPACREVLVTPCTPNEALQRGVFVYLPVCDVPVAPREAGLHCVKHFLSDEGLVVSTYTKIA